MLCVCVRERERERLLHPPWSAVRACCWQWQRRRQRVTHTAHSTRPHLHHLHHDVCMLWGTQGYMRIGHSLLAGQGDEAVRARVAQALGALMSANGLVQVGGAFCLPRCLWCSTHAQQHSRLASVHQCIIASVHHLLCWGARASLLGGGGCYWGVAEHGPNESAAFPQEPAQLPGRCARARAHQVTLALHQTSFRASRVRQGYGFDSSPTHPKVAHLPATETHTRGPLITDAPGQEKCTVEQALLPLRLRRQVCDADACGSHPQSKQSEVPGIPTHSDGIPVPSSRIIHMVARRELFFVPGVGLC